MPHRLRPDLMAVLAGTVAGGAVLGLGGRLAMAALPFLTGTQPRVSWGGSLEVVLLGTSYGVLGGIMLAALRRVLPRSGVGSGAVLGVVLLGVAWASSAVGRTTASTAPMSVPVVVLISALVFVIYGITANALTRRWSAPRTGIGARAA